MDASTAIVYPLKRGGSKWGRDKELRYSLRGVARYFEEDVPVYLLSTSRPRWLSEEVVSVQAKSYLDALQAASELPFERVLWLNDDIIPLREQSIEDWGLPMVMGKPSRARALRWLASSNTWRRRLGKSLLWLQENDCQSYNFSTHMPYLFETKKMREMLRNGPWFGHKTAFETLYYNLYYTGHQDLRGRWRPSGDGVIPDDVEERVIANLTNKAIWQKSIARFIEQRLPEKSIYEK